jgi:hypothetical protein
VAREEARVSLSGGMTMWWVLRARAYVSAEFIGHCCFSEFVFCLLFIA